MQLALQMQLQMLVLQVLGLGCIIQQHFKLRILEQTSDHVHLLDHIKKSCLNKGVVFCYFNHGMQLSVRS